jgi:hypothetical protein
MIKINIISFECATVNEAVVLSKQLGISSSSAKMIQTHPEPLDVTPSNMIPLVSLVKTKPAKKEIKPQAPTPDFSKEPVGKGKGTRLPNGFYDFLEDMKVGKSVTSTKYSASGAGNATYRLSKRDPSYKFTVETTEAGRTKITRIEV